jgi:molecular chaperone GrpE
MEETKTGNAKSEQDSKLQKTHEEQEINALLEQKIAKLEQELGNANDKTMRCLAEIENVKRRYREEIDKSSKFAISDFVSDLVVVVENFFLASENAPKEELEKIATIKSYADAMLMTQKELIKVLEKNQVKRIFPLHQKFDHNFHEAISQIESEAEEGTILQVVQAGYTIADRLIRPALVGLAKKK